MKKQCSKCGESKELNDFCKNTGRNSGVKSECKKCKKESDKIYRQNNKEKILALSKRYYINNADKINSKIYSDITKKKRANRIRERRNNDSVFRLKSRLGSLISGAISRMGYTKKSRTFEILGCNYDFFISYIERKFTKGMMISNYGKWHLDHIIPISKAKSEKDVIDLNHYTNFQPLWEKDNLSKSNKMPNGHQLSLTI
ncbi:hypothetical protein KAR91_70830 [Candidatus Pacearchaeota archaeon]|nr:hypothetical protein [Candidatus Pacearchaeota archaeon]